MLRIDRKDKALRPMEKRSLQEAGFSERYDLQALIKKSPEAFFNELGEDLYLLAEELCPAEHVDDRIDLLAVDKQGATVVVELKRGSHKLQLLQGLAYAAMLSRWEPEALLECACRSGRTREAVREELEAFLTEAIESLNGQQRLILLAEGFEYEVLVTAQWLAEDYGLNVRCYRLVLASDGSGEFLSATRVYPAPEIEEHAPRRARSASRGGNHRDWPAALVGLEPWLREFYEAELASGTESNLNHRCLMYRAGRERRWMLYSSRAAARVIQLSRFEHDEAFWRKRLSEGTPITALAGGQRLRFYLHEAADLDAFRKAVTAELAHAVFTTAIGADDAEACADA